MNPPARTLRRKFVSQIAVLALPVIAAPYALADFSQTGAGPYDYNDTANWSGGSINNTFTSNSSLTADQVIYFGADTTLSGGLSIGNTSAYNRTFRGEGGARTLTLGGNLTLNGTGNSNSNVVVFGSNNSDEALNINLGASRTFTIGSNRTLEVLNSITGTGSLTFSGNGTLRLTSTTSDFTGIFQVGTGSGAGVVEVTKLADSGTASSIGKGNEIRFGGNGTNTLRYLGSGDSTNRRLLMGSAGAIIDSSGSGAVKFTNTATQLNGSTGSPRTITLTGTNTGDNTIATSFTHADAASPFSPGPVSIRKQGSGRWILAGNNTYTGDTIIDAGTLELGSSNSGGDGSNMILNGGTFATGGFSETFGTLTVNGNAVIDFGDGASALVFADSHDIAWGDSVSLSLINFTEGVDSIRFGTSNLGLSESQLAKITINGFAATINDEGFLTFSMIPEPSAIGVVAGLGGLFLAGARRRRAS
jgi:autotransporter-associated beta strand repeat